MLNRFLQNDIILDSYVDTFSKVIGRANSPPSDLFEAFSASSILRKNHQGQLSDIETGILVGGGGDGAIDAIAILVNGHPIKAESDVRYIVRTLRRLDVEFVFVQAKLSPRFSADAMGSFFFGVREFWRAVSGTAPNVTFNSQIQEAIELSRLVIKQCAHFQVYAKCFLYYVTSGKWTGAADLEGRINAGKRELVDLNLFSDVFITPVDAETLRRIYENLERRVERVVEFTNPAVFPRIDGVDDAYIGLLPGDEFIKLVSTDDGELNRDLFYDNVRDFQGANSVNSEINDTLSDEGRRTTFSLLNNGITVVARAINRQGNRFTIIDFQIVNGCQTTHMIFQNKSKIDAHTFVPLKLVATNDSQVVTDVIRATNRQTEVLPEALESLTPFHKDLETFYLTQERMRNAPVLYERRSKQYAMDDVSLASIVTLTRQITSSVAMFLNEPHSVHR